MLPSILNSQFIMPSDVATRILSTAPWLTNTTRKRCQTARSKRVLSLASIVREGPHVWIYDDSVLLLDDVKLTRKYSARPLAWLLRVGPRCAKLRRRLQKAYEANKTPAVREKINAAVERLETMSDVAAAEIAHRRENTVAGRAEAHKRQLRIAGLL